MHDRLAAALLLLAATSVLAGPTSPGGSPGDVCDAPLLFVRVQGPTGMTATFYEGARTTRTFDAPVSVGMRPLVWHRARLAGFPDRPGVALYPSFEVRGTLKLKPNMRASDYPAPVIITEADVDQALAGTLITKVITLEDPDLSGGIAQVGGQPVEWDVPPRQDAIRYARDIGRPVLIVRIGMREPDQQQLSQLRAGSILYPGETALPPMASSPPYQSGAGGVAYPPPLPGQPGFPFPLPPAAAFGPRMTDSRGKLREEGGEECMRDGGDRGTRVHFDTTGEVQGIDPSDTVAEFKDSRGRRKLVASNEVCICVPRFVAVRQALPLAVHDGVSGPFLVDGRDQYVQVDKLEGARRTRQIENTPTMRSRQRLNQNIVILPQIRLTEIQELQAVHVNLGQLEAVGTDRVRLLTEEQKLRLRRQMELALQYSQHKSTKGIATPIGLAAVGRIDGLGRVEASFEAREVSCLCETSKPMIPEHPLFICKWASAEAAQVGDVLTFHIRYSNLGGQPIKDIALSDNLTGRLEYIPGTAKSDREAVFVSQDNDAGSLLLRWEIRDPLPPGQRGVVTFQARVR
jgi:uncharacterized repeat protein (TIGR01451 family)